MVRSRKSVARLAAVAVAFALAFPAFPASAATRLETSLTGAAETPDPGDPDGFGAAKLKLSVRKQRVCFTLAAVDITLPATGAHIHKGVEGVAGDIVVTLRNPREIAGSGVGLATGCVNADSRGIVRRISNHPERFYVNVHNVDHPGGALRGQLG